MSTTTNIGLFKHDNPATNTDEFNVDKALNENWDKLDTAIGTDREKITTLETDNTTNKKDITDIKAKNTEQDKYIAELELENSRLREDLNGLPKATVSGESIDLSDSAEMRCELKIGGNSKQKTRSGKNKLLNDQPTGTLNGVTFTRDNSGIITANGTATNAIVFYLGSKFKTIEAGTYKLSDGRNDESNSTYFTYMDCYNTDGSAYQNGNLSTVGTSAIKYTESKMIKGRIVIRKGTTLNNIVFKPQLELVNSVDDKATEYEPYGVMPSPDYPSEVESCGDNGSINEVICNKNLLPINVTEKTMYGITITKKSDGTYSLNGTATTSFTFDLYSGDYIKLPSGTYTGQSGQMLGFYIRKDSGDYQTLSETNKKTNTFTITEDFIYNRIYMYIFSGKTYNNTILTPMLEEGSIATEFEEHKTQTYTIPTQQPFRAIGDTRDTFIKKNNKWYERHYIYRKIFDGTEADKLFYVSKNINNLAWITYNESSLLSVIKKPLNNNEDVDWIISSHFKSNTNSIAMYSSNTLSYISIQTAGNLVFTMDNTEITTVEGFKTWLTEQYNAGTPVYVDYILETPLDIECTEEQNKILDKIEKEAKTYKNVTHMYSTDNVSPVIDVTYKKDIDTMITNIEQAILSQGGNI